jgi:hypothetical protein
LSNKLHWKKVRPGEKKSDWSKGQIGRKKSDWRKKSDLEKEPRLEGKFRFGEKKSDCGNKID